MPTDHAPRTPEWPPRSAPRLFVGQALEEGAAVTLDGPQAHYLSRVMRIGDGDAVILCDDVTGEWAARVTATAKRDITLACETLLRPREAVPDFTLCAALLKKDRFDLVLEKATELGVARIQPVITRRCVADSLNMARARALTIEAAEQCARTALPVLEEPVRLSALLALWPANATLFFADEMASNAGATDVAPTLPAAAAFAGHHGPAALLTGPEGGFDEAERTAIRAHAASRAISLGPRILRGETAAMAGVALWMALSGDWRG